MNTSSRSQTSTNEYKKQGEQKVCKFLSCKDNFCVFLLQLLEMAVCIHPIPHWSRSTINNLVVRKI